MLLEEAKHVNNTYCSSERPAETVEEREVRGSRQRQRDRSRKCKTVTSI